DSTIRDQVMSEIRTATGGEATLINATVNDGVVSLWGLAQSDETRKAAEVAALNVQGVTKVENNLGHVQPWVYTA
ncbi:MAG: BON domain-containing protein, partial [Alphaproteobacteria bacterium]|nr:BON domain-containing protein [Alphaproteobacteria bacterium]